LTEDLALNDDTVRMDFLTWFEQDFVIAAYEEYDESDGTLWTYSCLLNRNAIRTRRCCHAWRRNLAESGPHTLDGIAASIRRARRATKPLSSYHVLLTTTWVDFFLRRLQKKCELQFLEDLVVRNDAPNHGPTPPSEKGVQEPVD